jgi:glycosyltransferase involved in cell wall biosynthesis
LKVLFSKFSSWDLQNIASSHPEYYAIRNIILKNPKNKYILVGDGENYGHFTVNGIQFYNIKLTNKFTYLLSYIIKFELCIILRPNTIVSMGIINSLPFGLVSRLVGSRFVPLITGELWYSLETLPGLMKKIHIFLLKAMLERSHVILVLSEAIRKEIIRDFKIPSKKILISKYKISDAFSPLAPNDLKSKLNSEGPIILTVCRISPVKGLEYLVNAAKIIVEKYPKAKFVVKGEISDYEYMKEIEKLIDINGLKKQFVINSENSPNTEIAKYMAAADVFVLASISEGLGVVILEALSSGLPVVATSVGGIVDIISNENNGLLVEARNYNDLAHAVIRILSDAELKNRLIAGGLSTIKNIKEKETGLEEDLRRYALE